MVLGQVSSYPSWVICNVVDSVRDTLEDNMSWASEMSENGRSRGGGAYIYICIIVHFSYNHMLRYILWQAEFRHILLCFEAVIECVVPSRHWPHPCACPSWATSVHRLTSPIHWAILLWHEWARSPRHRFWRQSKPCGSVRTCEALQDRGSCGALFESEHWLNWLRVDK